MRCRVYVLKEKNPPAANASDDLTRRGGVALTGEQKQEEMAKLLENCPPVVVAIMTHASVDDVTRAGFFDRENQTLSYVNGRVALLGDAVSRCVCWPRLYCHSREILTIYVHRIRRTLRVR